LIGAWVGAAEATLDRVLIRDLVGGAYGDSLMLEAGLAGTTVIPSIGRVTGSIFESSPRGGISNLGSDAYIRDSLFDCNTIDLVGQTLGFTMSTASRPAFFEDQGGNTCRCSDNVHECKVLSDAISAPGMPEPPRAPGE
jgi:hypothetical protein